MSSPVKAYTPIFSKGEFRDGGKIEPPNFSSVPKFPTKSEMTSFLWYLPAACQPQQIWE